MPYTDKEKGREVARKRAARIRRGLGIPIRTKQSEEERKESQKIARRKYRQSHKTQNAQSQNLFYHRNKERLLQERREWRAKNQIQQKIWQKTTAVNLRKQIINGYGGKCACCGETEYHFLDIDHIKNDGKRDRIKFYDCRALYRWLRENEFPTDDYQLLCSNCNQGKRRNRGICPHKVVV